MESQTRNTIMTVTRNLTVIEGGVAGLLAVTGVAFVFPLIVAFLALVIYGGMKVYNNKELAANAPQAIEPVHEKTIYDCANYDQSSFDFKLAEEGVIPLDEVSLCDDDDCKMCRPEYDRRVKAEKEARRQERLALAKKLDMEKMADLTVEQVQTIAPWSKSDVEYGEVLVDQMLDAARVWRNPNPGPKLDICQACQDLTLFNGSLCPKCRTKRVEREERERIETDKRRAAAIAKAAAEQEARDYEAGRTIRFNGITIVRPHEVPIFAEHEFEDTALVDNVGYVVWKWLEQGKIKYMRQAFVADRMTATFSDASGAKRTDSWVAVYDPDTKEHLGDYRRINGKTETREPQPKNYNHIHTGPGCACVQSRKRAQHEDNLKYLKYVTYKESLNHKRMPF